MVNILAPILFVLFSCNRDSIEILPSRLDLPDQESWGVTILLTNEGKMRAKIASGHLEKHNEKEFIMLDELVKVDFYDNAEKHTSVITSNIAEVNQASNDMKAIGNVIAVSDSGITLYSNSLTYNSKKEELHTKEKIMITTLENDTLYGTGFESDSDLKNWRILKPSGVTNRGLE